MLQSIFQRNIISPFIYSPPHTHTLQRWWLLEKGWPWEPLLISRLEFRKQKKNHNGSRGGQFSQGIFTLSFFGVQWHTFDGSGLALMWGLGSTVHSWDGRKSRCWAGSWKLSYMEYYIWNLGLINTARRNCRVRIGLRGQFFRAASGWSQHHPKRRGAISRVSDTPVMRKIGSLVSQLQSLNTR